MIQDDEDEDVAETAKTLDLDVEGVDPTAGAPQQEGGEVDAMEPSDDEAPDDIIADLGSLGTITEADGTAVTPESNDTEE